MPKRFDNATYCRDLPAETTRESLTEWQKYWQKIQSSHDQVGSVFVGQERELIIV